MFVAPYNATIDKQLSYTIRERVWCIMCRFAHERAHRRLKSLTTHSRISRLRPEGKRMSEPKTIQLPWQGLLAVAAAIVGVVWYLAPLDTSRPTERFGQAVGTNEVQDVDARLWQDPLLAAHLHIALDEKGQKKC